MTVALDAAGTESERTGTTDPHTWTHTPVGTLRGVVVAVIQGTSLTPLCTAVTYGGQAMQLIVEAIDSAGEAGVAQLWFLGSNIPTGAQTVSCDLTSASGTDMHFVSWGLTAARDTEVIDFDEINGDVANPTLTLQSGGRTKWSVCAMYGGAAAPGGTLAAGNTLDATFDLGNFYSQTCRETTIDDQDHTIGWSTLASDDVAMVALAVTEKWPAVMPPYQQMAQWRQRGRTGRR